MNRQCPTCFQRNPQSSKEPLQRWKIRSMPASMMTSRTTSVTSKLVATSLPQSSMLAIKQCVDMGTSTVRICWLMGKKAKWLKMIIYPNGTWYQPCSSCLIMIEIQGRNSPCNRNDKLVTHTAPAIATTTLFLFQMAKLEWSISKYFGEIVVTQKRWKLTCGGRSIAKLSLGQRSLNPRDKRLGGSTP